jgi:hypothetical protein
MTNCYYSSIEIIVEAPPRFTQGTIGDQRGSNKSVRRRKSPDG